jgi:hypothetical protein
MVPEYSCRDVCVPYMLRCWHSHCQRDECSWWIFTLPAAVRTICERRSDPTLMVLGCRDERRMALQAHIPTSARQR